VQEFLKLLHRMPTDIGTALVFNGLANLTYKSRLPRRDDCLSHETYTNIQPTRLNHQSTVTELFREGRRLTHQPVSLVLDRDWVQELVCDVCQNQVIVGQTLGRVSAAEGVCGCGQAFRPVTRHEIPADFLWEPQDQNRAAEVGGELRLCDLGIPDWDILKLVTEDGTEHFWELSPLSESYRPALPRSDSSVGDDDRAPRGPDDE